MGNTLLVFVVVFGLNHEIMENRESVALDEKDRCRAMKQEKGSDPETFLQLYLSHQISRPLSVGCGPCLLMERGETGFIKALFGLCPGG